MWERIANSAKWRTRAAYDSPLRGKLVGLERGSSRSCSVSAPGRTARLANHDADISGDEGSKHRFAGARNSIVADDGGQPTSSMKRTSIAGSVSSAAASATPAARLSSGQAPRCSERRWIDPDGSGGGGGIARARTTIRPRSSSSGRRSRHCTARRVTGSQAMTRRAKPSTTGDVEGSCSTYERLSLRSSRFN